MTDGSLQVFNKPECLEVRDCELLITIATNMPIELPPVSPVFRGGKGLLQHPR